MTFNKLIFISFIVLLELNYQFVTAVLPVILSNQLEWQDFNCNKSYECLNSTKLKLWVYHSKDYDQKYFYFFYEVRIKFFLELLNLNNQLNLNRIIFLFYSGKGN